MTPQPKPILDWINNEINAISPIVAARMRRANDPRYYNNEDTTNVRDSVTKMCLWHDTKEKHKYWMEVRETIAEPNFRDPIELLPKGYEDVVVEELPYIIETVKRYNPKYGDDKLCTCGHRYMDHNRCGTMRGFEPYCKEFTPAPVPTEPTKEERIEKLVEEWHSDYRNKGKYWDAFVMRKLAQMQIEMEERK
jgi:hypothetical protein